MSVSRSRESTIKRYTASMARALAWLKNTSSCTVSESVFTTIMPVRIPRYAQSERDNEHAAGQRQIRGDGDRTIAEMKLRERYDDIWLAVRAQ
jgi:hypothetical protein